MPLNTTQEFLYDARLLKRHLASGKITKKDVEAFLRSLPDAQENSEVIPRETLLDLIDPASKSDPE